jgi:signal transduction histidine kinase/FixJ family two-component response regulator
MSPPPLERFVLCVDDDQDFLKSLEGFLPQLVSDPDDRIRHQFLFLSDPVQALRDLDDLVSGGETVAMLLTDQQMPTMKGLEFLGEARDRTPNSVRVLLTGHAGTDSAIEAINDKLLDKYITKPIYDENEFSQSIRHLLQNFEMRCTIGRQNETIQKLYDFATELHGCEDLTATLDQVARFAADSLDEAWVCVALVEDDRVTMSATRGLPPLDSARYETLPPHENTLVVRHAVTNEKQVPGIGAALAALDGASSRSWIHIPIVAEGRRLGLVCGALLDPSPAAVESAWASLGYVASTASMALHTQVNRERLKRAYMAEKEHAAALDETNRRLKSLDRMKNDFLAFISHELRTPLNFMAALALVDEASDPEERERMLAIARGGYDRLQRFVSRGLEYFDWIASTRLHVADRTDLAGLAASIIASYRAQEANRTAFELIAPDACSIAMDERNARDLLCILIDNALKFSDGSPSVRVEVASTTAGATLVVADRGRGFEPEMASGLFQPFTVAHVMQHREGTALSLAIAAAIVEAHGGRIEASSPGQGHGASFTVSLPRPGSEECGRSGSADDPRPPESAAA